MVFALSSGKSRDIPDAGSWGRKGMSGALIKSDDQYRSWLQEVSKRFRQSRIGAAVHVNAEMLRFYWTLGRDMESMKGSSSGGAIFMSGSAGIFRKSCRTSNPFLREICYICISFTGFFRKLRQAGAQSAGNGITPQVDAQWNEDQVFRIP